MNKIEEIINQLKNSPETVEFKDVIDAINSGYNYIPTRFVNGPEDERVINEAGENEGSCKIFTFAKINDLSPEQTLNCFGRYYRDDVLKNPQKTDHQNIRIFMRYGWEQIVFDGTALQSI